MYELWSKNLGTGNVTQLNAEFRTKQAGLKTIRRMNKRKTTHKIGGRGFKNRKEAVKFRNWRIRNPPSGRTAEDMRREMVIQEIPKNQQTKLFLKKR
ncbi:hypothetical protein CL617_00580 [archaeon]|nr:hypothetical protein [archaeon]